MSDQEQACPPPSEPVFFDPNREVDRSRHWLPHWEQGRTLYFVTWRLADSLPQPILAGWYEERQAWLAFHPEPWNRATYEEYHTRFSSRIDNWLDRGEGSCLLRDPANARIVADTLCYFDRQRYRLDAFVVMPNHVHVLFLLGTTHRIDQIIRSWKGYSARKINIRMGRSGVLWQAEYFDRLIRSEQHYHKCRAYIEQNPERAGLKEGSYWLECPGLGVRAS